MKIDLFLEGNQVEINQDIDFVLNKQFTELSDLTSIIVDYSKTIKVPMTPHNNELFNYVYKLDHQVLVNQGIVTYDPSQKISMVMNYNGSTVMEGYALLNSVDLKNQLYEVNLYGQLGKIFSDMKEKLLKDYKKGTNGWFKSMRMHTLNIANSFANDHHSLSWNSNDWTDFYGFAPQLLGDSDVINTDSYEKYGTGDIIKFEDVINTTRGITYADVYVKEGLDFNQYQEVRTYTTRPYVYVDKIIQLVQNEINNGDYDGYTMTLENDWFNSNNPYYNNLVFFPGNESIVDSGESTSGMVSWDTSERWMGFPESYIPMTTSIDLDGYTYDFNGTLITVSATGGNETTATLTLNCDGIVVRDRVTGVGSTSGFNQNGKWAFYNLSSPQTVPIRYIGIYDANDQLINKLYLCDDTIHSVTEDSGFLYHTWSHYPMGGVWNILKKISPKNIVPNSTTWVNHSSNNNYCEVEQVYNFGNVVLNTNSFKFKMECDYINIPGGKISRANIQHSEYRTLCPFKNDKYKDTVWENGATWYSYFRPVSTMTVTSNTYRSGSIWNINDILGNDFNPFTWLIDYVKQFRLFFDIDYNTKTITLKSGYFDNISYKKVTVDYSKGVVVEPVVDKYNKINYGYRENDSKKGVQYYKNNGVEYGDLDISTLININNEKMSLSPNEDTGVFIPIMMDCLTWGTLNSNQTLRYTNALYTNKVITTLDKDGKIQYFPFFAFRDYNSTTYTYITDDSPNQRNTGEYCYLEHSAVGEGWRTMVETTEGGSNVFYELFVMYLPQFDNYIKRDVVMRNTTPRGVRSVEDIDNGDSESEALLTPVNEVDPDAVEDTIVETEYTDPMTGRQRVIRRSRTSNDEEEEQTYLFWDTFGVPAEVYNGYLPSNIDSYCVYNRWRNYLNEIFNVHNKKVTCYVRMSYPEFINFKFNQLFVIDNCTFLVNKIIDFNPNSTAPTKVELIMIDDVTNLK